MWIEHKKALIDLSKVRSIFRSNDDEISIDYSDDLTRIKFKTTEEADSFWDELKKKLGMSRFGEDKIPC